MKNYRVGDRVEPIFEMGKKGTILELNFFVHDTWMVGGAAQRSITAKIKFDNNVVKEYFIRDIMPVED